MQPTNQLGFTWRVSSELLQASLQLLGHGVAQLLQAQFAGGLGHQAAGLASLGEQLSLQILAVYLDDGRAEVFMGGREFIFPAPAQGLGFVNLTSQANELSMLVGVDAALKRTPFEDEGVGGFLQLGLRVSGQSFGLGYLSPRRHKIGAISCLAR